MPAKQPGVRLWGIDVLLNGKRTGEIHRVASGFQYKPHGGKAGNVLATLEAVKSSLDDDFQPTLADRAIAASLGRAMGNPHLTTIG